MEHLHGLPAGDSASLKILRERDRQGKVRLFGRIERTVKCRPIKSGLLDCEIRAAGSMRDCRTVCDGVCSEFQRFTAFGGLGRCGIGRKKMILTAAGPGGAGGAILSVLSGGPCRKILSYVNICEFWRKGPKKVGGSFLKIPLRFSERY